MLVRCLLFFCCTVFSSTCLSASTYSFSSSVSYLKDNFEHLSRFSSKINSANLEISELFLVENVSAGASFLHSLQDSIEQANQSQSILDTSTTSTFAEAFNASLDFPAQKTCFHSVSEQVKRNLKEYKLEQSESLDEISRKIAESSKTQSKKEYFEPKLSKSHKSYTNVDEESLSFLEQNIQRSKQHEKDFAIGLTHSVATDGSQVNSANKAYVKTHNDSTYVIEPIFSRARKTSEDLVKALVISTYQGQRNNILATNNKGAQDTEVAKVTKVTKVTNVSESADVGANINANTLAKTNSSSSSSINTTSTSQLNSEADVSKQPINLNEQYLVNALVLKHKQNQNNLSEFEASSLEQKELLSSKLSFDERIKLFREMQAKEYQQSQNTVQSEKAAKDTSALLFGHINDTRKFDRNLRNFQVMPLAPKTHTNNKTTGIVNLELSDQNNKSSINWSHNHTHDEFEQLELKKVSLSKQDGDAQSSTELGSDKSDQDTENKIINEEFKQEVANKAIANKAIAKKAEADNVTIDNSTKLEVVADGSKSQTDKLDFSKELLKKQKQTEITLDELLSRNELAKKELVKNFNNDAITGSSVKTQKDILIREQVYDVNFQEQKQHSASTFEMLANKQKSNKGDLIYGLEDSESFFLTPLPNTTQVNNEQGHESIASLDYFDASKYKNLSSLEHVHCEHERYLSNFLLEDGFVHSYLQKEADISLLDVVFKASLQDVSNEDISTNNAQEQLNSSLNTISQDFDTKDKDNLVELISTQNKVAHQLTEQEEKDSQNSSTELHSNKSLNYQVQYSFLKNLIDIVENNEAHKEKLIAQKRAEEERLNENQSRLYSEHKEHIIGHVRITPIPQINFASNSVYNVDSGLSVLDALCFPKEVLQNSISSNRKSRE